MYPIVQLRLAETRRSVEPAYLDWMSEVRCRFSSPGTEPVLCCRLNSVSLGWLRGCDAERLGGRAWGCALSAIVGQGGQYRQTLQVVPGNAPALLSTTML
jgi:hypothetical protein